MNFFFGIKNKCFISELQIPRFQNRKPNNINDEIKLFKCFINKSKWSIAEVNNDIKQSDFFILKENITNSNDIFFLARDHEIKNFNYDKLKPVNSFTNTNPAYRSNLKIQYKNHGFSSYQSEYPSSMIAKKGSIFSSVSSICNKNAEKNYLMFRNIFYLPLENIFQGYFINIKEKKIEETVELKLNHTNLFEINEFLIKPEIFFFTKNYLGIPVYLSENKGHLSMEHTHPPHSTFLSMNKFEKVKNLKEKIHEIVS